MSCSGPPWPRRGRKGHPDPETLLRHPGVTGGILLDYDYSVAKDVEARGRTVLQFTSGEYRTLAGGGASVKFIANLLEPGQRAPRRDAEDGTAIAGAAIREAPRLLRP